MLKQQLRDDANAKGDPPYGKSLDPMVICYITMVTTMVTTNRPVRLMIYLFSVETKNVPWSIAIINNQ